MRVAHNDITLRSSIKAAQQEAETAFKDGTIFVEKYPRRTRDTSRCKSSADKFGQRGANLWERDCTLQRRHQKLVEESPCPVIDQKTREELCASAVRLAKEANYYSACTCEFIMDKDRKFYFLEVNTRIQVEHPVTELVTGVDLIKWQLKIAAGEKLTLKQSDIPQRGLSDWECRINAEDPEQEFHAVAGDCVDEFIAPGGPNVRLETHAHQGYKVPPNYDSMIAKLLAYGATRDDAITTMKRALEEFRVGPIKTTIPLHRQIMDNQQFRNAKVDTGWIERTYKEKDVRQGTREAGELFGFDIKADRFVYAFDVETAAVDEGAGERISLLSKTLTLLTRVQALGGDLREEEFAIAGEHDHLCRRARNVLAAAI